jgi:uncharacterized protein YndB with AHSA1/START domain
MSSPAPIRIERSLAIRADREKIWRVLTTPEHFSKWFGMKIQFDSLEIGTPMSFSESGEYVEYEDDDARIRRVDPPEWFAFTWTPEPGFPTETLVTFHLEVIPDGTLVTVTEEGLEALPEAYRRTRFELNDRGWKLQLNNIAEYLEKHHDL